MSNIVNSIVIRVIVITYDQWEASLNNIVLFLLGICFSS